MSNLWNPVIFLSLDKVPGNWGWTQAVENLSSDEKTLTHEVIW
jgi:hypothetical protein